MTKTELIQGNCLEKTNDKSSCRVLNLYAGIGGNREKWTECKVTAVECDEAIAEVYALKFPQDKVIVGDACDYVQKHYKQFDFIWASPPCPTHGQYRHNVGVIGKGFAPVIPDMTPLYGLIVFLQTYFTGKWCVENVKPYYTPLIPPTFELQRHLFWANFYAEQRTFKAAGIRRKNKISDFDGAALVKPSRITNKRQVLRNCVDAELGLHIFKAALQN